MKNELPVKLVKQKIEELQTALFFPEASSQTHIPNYVVEAAQTDDQGNIWFMISRPAIYLDLEEGKFPCRLDFFKKGKGFHLKIQGSALFVNQYALLPMDMGISNLKQKMESGQAVAVKVMIEHADLFEIPSVTGKGKAQDGVNLFINWLFKAQYIQRSRRIMSLTSASGRLAHSN